MRTERIVITLLCAIIPLAGAMGAQRRPEVVPVPRITAIAPRPVEAGKQPADIVVEGTGFDKKAMVRIRRLGERGNGLDYTATVESPTRLELRIPVEWVERPGTLELRVKNPTGEPSDWAQLEVRAQTAPGDDQGPRRPIISRINPAEVEAGSRSIHLTIYGRDIRDGAAAAFRAPNVKTEVAGNVVNGTLVVLVPDEVLAKPQTVIVQVRNPSGDLSDNATLEVVAPRGGTKPETPGEPFITQVEPDRVDLRGVRSRRVQIIGRDVDRNARVLLRQEGSSEAGKLVPVVERSTATNGTVLGVEITPAMIRFPGAYEFRVVNANGRQSNWARVEFVSGDEGPGQTNVSLDVRFPQSATLTAVTTTVPVEISARNGGRNPVRIGNFKILTAAGERMPVEGSFELATGASRQMRLEAPVPLSVGARSKSAVRLEVALEYTITVLTSRNVSFDGRDPSNGFTVVPVRNEIALVGIGREYVTDPEQGAGEGWRFFKTANEANEGEGRLADFYLFDQPFAARQKLPTDELYNFRPAENTREVFFLTLTGDEIASGDPRNRERGTRLGYVSTQPAPGLVPLYRWVLSDLRRTQNHFLTIENDRSKLPKQLQRGAWKLDRVVGYVVPRS